MTGCEVRFQDSSEKLLIMFESGANWGVLPDSTVSLFVPLRLSRLFRTIACEAMMVETRQVAEMHPAPATAATTLWAPGR